MTEMFHVYTLLSSSQWLVNFPSVENDMQATSLHAGWAKPMG